MRDKLRSVDREVAGIAARQHGVVTASQLYEAGLSRAGVKRRADKGALHRVHRGVYRVGHQAPSTEAAYMAAVLACGTAAALSGAAMAFLYGLAKGRPPRPEVTTTADRAVPGVTVHRARHLHPRDTSVYRGIPATTVPRVIVDMAARLDIDEIARVCHQAKVLHGVGREAVAAVIERAGRVDGGEKLREVYGRGYRITLSKLERAFLAVLRARGMPLPLTNRSVSGRYVDCRWPELDLTVELDSYSYHSTRHAWELDRRREREARARGDEFRRYTYADVTEDQELMLAELRELLGED